jgi:hypothetical protein
LINGSLNTSFAVTPDSTLGVLKRSATALTTSAMRAVTISTFEFCKLRGCELEVASPPARPDDDPLNFSTSYLLDMYQTGFGAAVSGNAWRTSPSMATDVPN